jgi:hypothetical protein
MASRRVACDNAYDFEILNEPLPITTQEKFEFIGSWSELNFDLFFI